MFTGTACKREFANANSHRFRNESRSRVIATITGTVYTYEQIKSSKDRSN